MAAAAKALAAVGPGWLGCIAADMSRFARTHTNVSVSWVAIDITIVDLGASGRVRQLRGLKVLRKQPCLHVQETIGGERLGRRIGIHRSSEQMRRL